MPARNPLQRDLEVTIAHVVGQGVVALRLGCEIHFQVEKHPGGEHFDGCCHFRHEIGEIPPRILRPVGVAGPIAEAAFLGGGADCLDSFDLFAKLKSGHIAPSGSSASQADGFTFADVDFAVSVLQSNWSIVVAEVERMTPCILHDTARPH